MEGFTEAIDMGRANVEAKESGCPAGAIGSAATGDASSMPAKVT